jgi:uncharacterized membrane protein
MWAIHESLMYLKYLINITINDYDVATILWNIFLAVIPFFLCGYLINLQHHKKFKKIRYRILGLIIGFLWLISIPNTAYIINDIRHITDFCPPSLNHICAENAWMIMFFFSYGTIGWILFVYSINQMKLFLNEFKLNKFNDYFSYIAVPLIALGVLLGLVDRFNSWEIFIYPRELFGSLIKYLTDWQYFKNWLIFTLFLYILYFSGNMIFIPIKKKRLNIKINID